MTLLLGPVLRHVSDTTALVWVQTDCAATVEVLGCSAPTFAVQGHHYALVAVTGLTPDTVTEYDVKVGGELVWPLADSPFPPSVIRTRGPASTHRLQAIFGSCRYPKAKDEKLDAKVGLDALDVVNLRTELPAYYRKFGYVEHGTRAFPDGEQITRACHCIVMRKPL